MEMADAEAAFVGNLARYCMDMRTIPFKPRRGFYWRDGVCLGMKPAMLEDEYDLHGEHTGVDVLAPIQKLVDHLRMHVGAILQTEGVEPILEAGEQVRWYSLKLFPTEEDQWLTEAQAQSYTGRGERTLRMWRKAGAVDYLKDGGGIIYRKADLDVVMEIKRSNMMRGYQP